MSAPRCDQCEYGRITLSSATDKCKHSANIDGLHPVAMRNNENLCGQAAALFMVRVTPIGDPYVVPKQVQPIEEQPMTVP